MSNAVGQVAEELELLVSALCLTAIHLLNEENHDRKSTDKRLRVAEAGPFDAHMVHTGNDTQLQYDVTARTASVS
jgi:hypothetical protein